jgi:acyl dehydratase
MSTRYFEDFAVGQRYRSASRRLEGDRIKSFAAEFDPQPFHLDDAGARDTIFHGLAASGWHTAALSMRLLTESGLDIAGGIIGAGVEALRWPQPARPGDELRLDCEVIEVRPSQSKPHQGWIKLRMTTLNQSNEAVQVLVADLLVPRRPA